MRQRHRFEGLLGAHRRVVDQDVDAAEARQRRGRHVAYRVRIGDIGGDGEPLPAGLLDLARDRLRLGHVGARIDHDGGAAVRQRQRNGAADIASGPGHDRDATGEFLAHGVILSGRGLTARIDRNSFASALNALRDSASM